jgi:hypothetical protein
MVSARRISVFASRVRVHSGVCKAQGAGSRLRVERTRVRGWG